jgi:hypothetical protein
MGKGVMSKIFLIFKRDQSIKKGPKWHNHHFWAAQI